MMSSLFSGITSAITLARSMASDSIILSCSSMALRVAASKSSRWSASRRSFLLVKKRYPSTISRAKETPMVPNTISREYWNCWNPYMSVITVARMMKSPVRMGKKTSV